MSFKVLHGVLHRLNLDNAELQVHSSEQCNVLLEEQLFAEGGVREARRVHFLVNGKVGQLKVAKKYKRKQSFHEDFRIEQIGRKYVKDFNQALSQVGIGSKVNFVGWTEILEVGDEMYTIEEFMNGRFRKYNNIFGFNEGNDNSNESDLAAAFSHYTYTHSNKDFVILDVQGVGNSYTDLAIVSTTPQQYGFTDTGPSGIQGFLTNHTCGHTCKLLNLQPTIADHSSYTATSPSRLLTNMTKIITHEPEISWRTPVILRSNSWCGTSSFSRLRIVAF